MTFVSETQTAERGKKVLIGFICLSFCNMSVVEEEIFLNSEKLNRYQVFLCFLENGSNKVGEKKTILKIYKS